MKITIEMDGPGDADSVAATLRRLLDGQAGGSFVAAKVDSESTASTAPATTRTRRTGKSPDLAAPFSAGPKPDPVDAYNALAAATGAPVVELTPAEEKAAAVEVETILGATVPDKQPEPEKPAEAPPAASVSRDDMLSKVREHCAKQGAVWMRENIMTPNKVNRLSDLPDEALAAAYRLAVA